MPEPRKEPQPKTGPNGADDGTVDPREQSLRERESAVAARERAIGSGERAGDATRVVQRENAVAAREEAVLSREGATRLREEAVRAVEEATRERTAREALLVEIRDVNERLIVATLHAELMTEEAQKANRLKDDFLAVVSHELRTPLNAILGWARMLGAGQVKEERVADAIRTIERNASMLAHIINDLLDVSRIIAGTLQLACEPVDLVAATQSAVDTVAPVAAAKSIQLSFSYDSSSEPVIGDVIRLQQVVWNLLSNAIKFTSPGGRVNVSLTCAGSIMELTVADTGQGISADALPHVFERFWQGETTSTRHQGLGLGLAIARQLVELHNGTIAVNSPGLGQGATFTIRLPVLTSPTLLERRVPMQDRTVLALPRLDGLHVLLVEAHTDGREFISAALEQAGANVTAVGSVKDALQALEGERPDALVSDIGLPDEDGYALIAYLRQREAARGGFLPAVAISGYARAEDRVRVLAAGYQAHLSKPVEPAELAAAIASLTRATRAASSAEQ